MLYDKRWDRPETKPKRLSPIDKTDWRQILLRAADILERRGWCQGGLTLRYNGQVVGHCAMGAISVAAIGKTMGTCESEERLKALHAAVSWMEADVGTLVSWNDTCGRKKEEVVAKLREVAKS